MCYMGFAIFMVLAIALSMSLLTMRLKAGRRLKKSLLQLEDSITVLKSREMDLQNIEEKLRAEVDTMYPDIKRISFYANELVLSEKAYRRQHIADNWKNTMTFIMRHIPI